MLNDNVIMYINSLKHSDNMEASSNEFIKVIKKMEESRRRSAILDIFKYCITGVLKWTPEYAKENLTVEMLDKLRIMECVRQGMITLPVGLPDECVPRYLISVAYPKYKMDKQWIVDVYKKSLYEKTGLSGLFFVDDYGTAKAYICLITAIKEFLPDATLAELYELFGDSKRAKAFLTNAKLIPACREQCAGIALYYLHYALGEQRSTIHCEANMFMDAYRIKIRDTKRLYEANRKKAAKSKAKNKTKGTAANTEETERKTAV